MSKKVDQEELNEEQDQDVSLSGDEEGTVDWDAAEEFMNGKADGDEADDTDDDDDDLDLDDEEDGEEDSQDPELVPVRLKGHTIYMTEAQAAAFEDYRRENRERDGRLGGELSQSRERIARLEALAEERDRLAREQLENDGPKMPAPEEAIRDFPKWQEKFQAYQQYEQAKLLSTLEKKHLAERQAEQRALAEQQRHTAWANAFYADNPHLNNKVLKPIVASVFEENEKELASYGDDYARAFDRLAELTDARMAEIMSVRKKNPNRAPTLESSQSRAVAKKPKKPSKPFTISDWSDKKRSESSTR